MKYPNWIYVALFILASWLFIPKEIPAGQIRAIWTSEVGTFAPVWVSKETGAWKKYGNDVQLIFIQGATSAVAALLAGDAQVGFFSPTVAISSTIRGQEMVLLARFGNSLDNRIYSRQEITDLKQVKSIAISRYGSNADFAARLLLERAGLRPDTDVALLQFGNQINRLAAVETKRADGAIVTPPMTLKARKMGFRLLVDASKLDIPYSSSFIVVRKDYLDKNRETIVNFIKGYIEGLLYYKTRKEESLKILSKYLRLSLEKDRDVLEENYREYDFPHKPYPDTKYIELPIKELARKEPKVLRENPRRFVDPSIVRDLDESGFIDRLTKEYGLTK